MWVRDGRRRPSEQPPPDRAERKHERAEVAQRRPGAEDQLADARVRMTELGRDLAVAAALELPEGERAALTFGKRLDRGDHARELLLLLEHAGRLRHPVEIGIELVVLVLLAKQVDRAVTCDA